VSETLCQICTRPLADGAAVCPRCAASTRDSLAYVLARHLLDELETTTTRQVRYGSGSGGRRATDEAPLPVNLRAGHVEARTRNTITTWARTVLDGRGTTPEEVWPDIVPPIGPRCQRTPQSTWCTHPSCRRIVQGVLPVALDRLAQALLDRIEWIRHQEYAVVALSDLAKIRGDIETVCDAPPKLIALGKCDGHRPDGSVCASELRARKDVAVITCRACGQPYSVAARIEQLLRRVNALQATAPVIARVLTDWMGKPLPVDTIHQWGRARGKRPAKLQRRGTDPVTRQPLYRLGDVKALHQGSIQRDILIAARAAEKETQAA
jgi:hypothetical protein